MQTKRTATAGVTQ